MQQLRLVDRLLDHHMMLGMRIIDGVSSAFFNRVMQNEETFFADNFDTEFNKVNNNPLHNPNDGICKCGLIARYDLFLKELTTFIKKGVQFELHLLCDVVYINMYPSLGYWVIGDMRLRPCAFDMSIFPHILQTIIRAILETEKFHGLQIYLSYQMHFMHQKLFSETLKQYSHNQSWTKGSHYTFDYLWLAKIHNLLGIKRAHVDQNLLTISEPTDYKNDTRFANMRSIEPKGILSANSMSVLLLDRTTLAPSTLKLHQETVVICNTFPSVEDAQAYYLRPQTS
jgi:hypothetical protein